MHPLSPLSPTPRPLAPSPPLQAILKADHEEHMRAGACQAAMDPKRGSTCPLCASHVAPDKEGWKQHFVEEGCSANPRTRQ